MSGRVRNRSLVLIACLLGLLLAAVVYLGLDRFGHLQEAERPSWVFENRMLQTPRGAWVRVRPMASELGELRCLFEARVIEPELVRDRKPDPRRDPPPFPFVRIFKNHRPAADQPWSFAGVEYAAFQQLGARTLGEWLVEIRLVDDRRPDGSRRRLLRALFGAENGSTTAYFYDPTEGDAAASRGWGWLRSEIYGEEKLSEVSFAYPDGAWAGEPAESADDTAAGDAG